MTPVRVEPAALPSRVKHSTTEQLHSLSLSDEAHKTLKQYPDKQLLKGNKTINPTPSG